MTGKPPSMRFIDLTSFIIPTCRRWNLLLQEVAVKDILLLRMYSRFEWVTVFSTWFGLGLWLWLWLWHRYGHSTGARVAFFFFLDLLNVSSHLHRIGGFFCSLFWVLFGSVFGFGFWVGFDFRLWYSLEILLFITRLSVFCWVVTWSQLYQILSA